MAIGSALLGLTILVIGDSHLATPGYLITTLQDDLMQQGAKVKSIGLCGIQPADWVISSPGNCGGAQRDGKSPVKALVGPAARTTAVAELIQRDKPDLVLVVMGDTMAGYKQPEFPATWAWQQVKRLTGAIAKTGVECAWIGPGWGQPGGKYGKNYDRVKQVGAFISENSAPCTYVDSLAMSQPGQWPTIDGQHFTGPGYTAWATGITAAVLKLPVVTKRKTEAK
ncbi:SGNH/GDSL hydrolase family protein [Xylophilus ampelinus]|uniref:Lysophospholipase L1-like esterase n=1 Tax=Xylophilus ampelinus TaxID=54067 RepID=A0A318SHF8_9BURK|nr:SGNH/GDSL hydrolase family protein [Xylophilus ampelinus]MCS4510090.1 SGNH/GDSL hydrolase family protein [Xylophilus ampelinus]PYE78238.1 hypothetical protein DFQ15_10827 [Xylophilus ampelinus]